MRKENEIKINVWKNSEGRGFGWIIKLDGEEKMCSVGIHSEDTIWYGTKSLALSAALEWAGTLNLGW